MKIGSGTHRAGGAGRFLCTLARREVLDGDRLATGFNALNPLATEERLCEAAVDGIALGSKQGGL